MASRIYLIRHGETEWSLSGQHTGRSDIPLTANGEDQARALAPWLERLSFAHVLTSPRQRARRTCELAGLGAAAVVEPDLAEWDYGDYEGRRAADIRTARPDWSLWRDGCPGGESPGDVSSRTDRLIDRLDRLDGDIALFSHGHLSRTLAVRWIGLPVAQGRHLSLGVASLSCLGVDPSHPDARVIALWNASPLAQNGQPPQ